MNLRKLLSDRISRSMITAGAPTDAPGLVAPSTKPQFGDYQANGCMAAAKKMKTNPRTFAEKVLETLDLSDVAEKVELAGPGFINIFLKDDYLTEQPTQAAGNDHLGVETVKPPQKVVVDYSGPNLAKEMHVGHLRSTIIGDALARIFAFKGWEVIPQNHVGDWGTQFGMLTAFMQDMEKDIGKKTHWAGLGDLEVMYREAKKRFDTDPEFAECARENVVHLQSGDADIVRLWGDFTRISVDHCKDVYELLGVLLKPDDVRGESAYNDDLPNVIGESKSAGLLEESDGAKGVYLDEFRNSDDERAFVIVQKSDGGYLYATTDLAAIRYRTGTLHADRILYVTDSRQAQHFAQVFLIAKRTGFAPEKTILEHVPFGMMLGTDGRPFKTRTGGTVKLMDLLKESQQRAEKLVAEKNPDLDEAARTQIASAVGIGALKYADLAQNRTSDYVFAWDKMLSLEGNTAPYMQYAYARIRSIFRKAADAGVNCCGEFRLSEPEERVLGMKLLQFSEMIDVVTENCLPNMLCGYLYELAGAFMSFYESHPVLKADDEIRTSRLAICDLTARVIKQGLDLLGIGTIEKM